MDSALTNRVGGFGGLELQDSQDLQNIQQFFNRGNARCPNSITPCPKLSRLNVILDKSPLV